MIQITETKDCVLDVWNQETNLVSKGIAGKHYFVKLSCPCGKFEEQEYKFAGESHDSELDSLGQRFETLCSESH